MVSENRAILLPAEHAAKLNFEGIVLKNAQAPYRSDRNEGWMKIKAVQKGQFPVTGFVKDPTGVAALYLGKREGKDLVFMGKVGTGWSRTVSSQIRKQLDTVVSPKSKLKNRSKSQRRRGLIRCFSRTWSLGYVGRTAEAKLVQRSKAELASSIIQSLSSSGGIVTACNIRRK
jgi:ATP-dependent DNA ligase